MNEVRYRVRGFRIGDDRAGGGRRINRLEPDYSEIFENIDDAYSVFYDKTLPFPHREVEVGELVEGEFVAKTTEATTNLAE